MIRSENEFKTLVMHNTDNGEADEKCMVMEEEMVRAIRKILED